ncbi:CALCIUM-DEPENDENT LIPID-BINDING (CALB DOMAIN) FAMILY PROTEIN [Salix koriyanagi]|uniref:CALCIUM-DEPENDENT LIPID-BINDING (CALB DOMAIN) FAMILY PROTEIN n=1 Tax=Salix koriyanagi TaxID=2511006 RepID=A0A9Q0WJE2_9ROSI|nr:CALCIUM-DEPENDENT LIPID-BINDING (CALB DOMAIN) FAMILY PROTEIN [Salix koriyanagi]
MEKRLALLQMNQGEMQGGNEDFVGELSVTLVDARKLSYVLSGKTDPYVILSLGDQIMRSKKNSQTTVIGRPGEPIWNQDFHMLVANPRKQKLSIQVKDSLGFTDLTVGTGEVDLGSLQDTVPTDKIVALRGGWGLFRKASSGEILLRLTYKAYVEDEDDDEYAVEPASDDELSDSDDSNAIYEPSRKKSYDEMDKESFMDVLAALIVSEEFQGIVASETGNSKLSIDASSLNAESMPSDSNNSSEGSAGSILVWFAVITSILVLIAVTMDGSSFFNP